MADLLLAFRVQPLAISDVSYIAERNHLHALPDRLLHHTTADLVFEIADFRFPSRSSFDFRSPQLMPSCRAPRALGHLGVQFGQTFVSVLDGTSEFPTTDDRGALGRRTDGRMNLPQVHAHHTAFFEQGDGQTVLDHKIPFIQTRLAVIDQTGFFDLCVVLFKQWLGQIHEERLPVGEGKADLVGFALDLAGFEDRAAETLALVRETGACVLFAKFAGSFDGLVEALLSGVDAVGVKDGIGGAEGIIDTLGFGGGHPHAVFAVKPPMTNEDAVVNLRAGAVESVENLPVLRRGCRPCENHLCTLS